MAIKPPLLDLPCQSKSFPPLLHPTRLLDHEHPDCS